MFGIRGQYGDLVFKPQLLKEQFDWQHEAWTSLIFAGKSLKVIYKNPRSLDPETYRITGISLNGIPCQPLNRDWGIGREELLKLPGQELHTITVDLNAE